MAQLNADGQVKEQYADGKNLSTRAGLHAKYSVNPMGLTNWLFNQYRFEPGGRILELGCGTGSQWEGWLEELPEGCSLILSDFSPRDGGDGAGGLRRDAGGQGGTDRYPADSLSRRLF